MTLRQGYAGPRPCAIARHPGPAGISPRVSLAQPRNAAATSQPRAGVPLAAPGRGTPPAAAGRPSAGPAA